MRVQSYLDKDKDVGNMATPKGADKYAEFVLCIHGHFVSLKEDFAETT
jgi:hypothetical protein